MVPRDQAGSPGHRQHRGRTGHRHPGDGPRVELDSENYETSGWLSGKPAGTLPVYQYSDANALDIVKQVRARMDRLARNFPPGLEYRIVYDTTKYVHENIVEVEHTLFEAFLLVLLVDYVEGSLTV